MPYALLTDYPVIVPTGIFLVYITLYAVKELINYAQVFWSKRAQQTNLAVSQNTSTSKSTTEGGKSPHIIFRPVGPVSSTTTEPKSSRGNSVSISGTKSPISSDTGIHIQNSSGQTTGPDYCETEDQNSQTHFCKEIPQNSNGSTPGGGAKDIPNFQRDNECDRLYEGSTSGSHKTRSESRAHKGLSKTTSCWADKGDSPDIRHPQTNSKATQISVKKCEVGTHPPSVSDPEDFDQLLFTFVQSVVQQAQQHMFQQLEQCMQQAYTSLTLGTPVRAQEYTEQFKKTNNTVVLTETKRLDVDNTPSEWDDQQDSPSGGAQLLSSQLLPSPDPDSTTSKSIQPSTSSFGGAQLKTERAKHSTAVISGCPAGSETDGEYEDYFNPRIFT